MPFIGPRLLMPAKTVSFVAIRCMTKESFIAQKVAWHHTTELLKFRAETRIESLLQQVIFKL